MSPNGPIKAPTEISEHKALLVDWINHIEQRINERLDHQDKQNDKILTEVAAVKVDVNAINVRLATGDEKMAQLKETEAAQEKHFEATDKAVEELKAKVEDKKSHYIAALLALLGSIGTGILAWLTGHPPTPPPGIH